VVRKTFLKWNVPESMSFWDSNAALRVGGCSEVDKVLGDDAQS